MIKRIVATHPRVRTIIFQDDIFVFSKDRRILPLCVFGGATFLCLADLGARTLLAPAEIPIGVLTAIVGAPFFLLLLRTSRVAMS